MKGPIVSAFEETRQGFSADRVIADPDLRRDFVEACSARGVNQTESEFCRMLLNLRKSGHLSHLKSAATRFQDDDYRFASEIALRILERREQVTLDDILCNSNLLSEFDRVCQELAPGYSPLRYRWAALSLRKSRSVPPEILGHALPSSDVRIVKCTELDLDTIEPLAGLYIFIGPRDTLYVGEASNLRVRLKKHFDHSDNKHLARYLWDRGIDDIHLEIHVLPEGCTTRVRRALERELIQSREPLFNVVGKPSETESSE